MKYQYSGKALILMDGFKGHDKSLEQISMTLEANGIEILKIPEQIHSCSGRRTGQN